MDRGTIVIRNNDKGVIFEVFEPGQRALAKIAAAKFIEAGDNVHICVNLIELAESHNWLWKKRDTAPAVSLPSAEIGPQVRAPFHGKRMSDGQWFVIELPALPDDGDVFDDLVLEPMRTRAVELAGTIEAALNVEPAGTDTKMDISIDDWCVIVAALRKQL